jgi:hypothetical protein
MCPLLDQVTPIVLTGKMPKEKVITRVFHKGSDYVSTE